MGVEYRLQRGSNRRRLATVAQPAVARAHLDSAPVGRGEFVGWLLLAASWLCTANPAHAASDLQIEHAADGTLVVVGSGWHRDQEMVISLGQQRFNVRADNSGDFELATGMASYQGDLAVHHAADRELAFVPLAEPHPFAVLFARSVAEGLVLLTFVVGVVMVAAGVARRVRAPRYPRG